MAMNAKPVKFMHMVNLPDMTVQQQGGFSNRFNTNVEEFRKAADAINRKNQTVRWTVTRKVDGVSCMVVAFVLPKNNTTQAMMQHLDPPGNDTKAIAQARIVSWQWDRQVASGSTSVAEQEYADMWQDHPHRHRRFHLLATRAFLLPRTVWSKRTLLGQEFYVNVSLYAPNGDCLKLPHYLRVSMENYSLLYYINKARADRLWAAEAEKGNAKVLAFRAEMILGKAEPSDASTFMNKLRKLKSNRSNLGLASSWPNINAFLEEMHFEECQLKRVMETFRSQVYAKNRDNKKKGLAPLTKDEIRDRVQSMMDDQEAVQQTKTTLYHRADQALMNSYDSMKSFFFINWLHEAQWNPSTVVESMEHKIGLHHHELAIVVLDDYSEMVKPEWIRSIVTALPDVRQANLIPLKGGANSVQMPANGNIPAYADRLQSLRQLSGDMGGREKAMMHTVDVVSQETWDSSTQSLVKDAHMLNLKEALQMDVSLRNGEGFMLTVESQRIDGLALVNVFKLKQFLWLSVFPNSLTSAFGYFDEVLDSDGDQKQRIQNKFVEPDESSKAFAKLLVLVNGHHWYTTKNLQSWKKKQAVDPQALHKHKAWLSTAQSKDPYQPWIMTMMPWGVYKNVNGLALTATLGTRDLVSHYNHVNSRPPVQSFWMWVQYVRSSRVRLMCTPCENPDDMTPRMRSQQLLQHEITEYHTKQQEHKTSSMFLQMVGIHVLASTWYKRIKAIEKTLKNPGVSQVIKEDWKVELQNMFLHSGSILKQLVYNYQRIESIQKPRTAAEEGIHAFDRIEAALYCINALKKSDPDTSNLHRINRPYIDGCRKEDLTAWGLADVKIYKDTNRFLVTWVKETKRGGADMKISLQQHQVDNEELTFKLLYEQHFIDNKRIASHFLAHEAFRKVHACVTQNTACHRLLHPFLTERLAAIPFRPMTKKWWQEKFEWHVEHPADQRKDNIKQFIKDYKIAVSDEHCNHVAQALDFMFTDSEDIAKSTSAWNADIERLKKTFQLSNIPLSMLVLPSNHYHSADLISKIGRIPHHDTLAPYWQMFEGYFDQSEGLHTKYSRMCLRQVQSLWKHDKVARKIVEQSRPREDEPEQDDEDEPEAVPAPEAADNAAVTASDRAFIEHLDEISRDFNDYKENNDSEYNTHHLFEWSEDEGFMKLRNEVIDIIVETLAFDNGYQWPIVQARPPVSNASQKALQSAEEENTDSFGILGVQLNGDNFEEEIEVSGDDFVTKMMDVDENAGEDHRAPETALLEVQSHRAQRDEEPFGIRLDEYNKLTLRDLLARDGDDESSYAGDLQSVQGDDEDFAGDASGSDFGVGVGGAMHRRGGGGFKIVQNLTATGELRMSWLKVLCYLHKKGAFKDESLVSVVQKNLADHRMLAQAWVAMHVSA